MTVESVSFAEVDTDLYVVLTHRGNAVTKRQRVTRWRVGVAYGRLVVVAAPLHFDAPPPFSGYAVVDKQGRRLASCHWSEPTKVGSMWLDSVSFHPEFEDAEVANPVVNF